MNRQSLSAIVVLIFALALILAPVLIFRPSVSTYAIGLLAGIPSGFLLSFLTWYWQTPSLVVGVAKSKYDGVSDGFWVHLQVRNRAWGFLGGGTAIDCRGRIKFDSGGEFVTKWKNRPNPRRPVIVQAAPGQHALIEIADASLYDQARSQTIRPGAEEWLDVAFRPKNAATTSSYVAIPENFQGPQIMLLPECELKADRHPFSVTVEYQGGASTPRRFVLIVTGSKALDASSLRIEPL
jgi:hypothetical protein